MKPTSIDIIADLVGAFALDVEVASPNGRSIVPTGAVVRAPAPLELTKRRSLPTARLAHT